MDQVVAGTGKAIGQDVEIGDGAHLAGTQTLQDRVLDDGATSPSSSTRSWSGLESSLLMAGPMTKAETENISANTPSARAGAFQEPKRR